VSHGEAEANALVSRERSSFRGMIPIRDTRLYVEIVGHGDPLLLMHGGPGADHWSMLPFRSCASQFTLVSYDHRCNGRSAGPPLSSMTWEDLTADAEALRVKLGFSQWAVLGHSWGGMVAMEYALRYPGSLSRLVLLDAGGDSFWQQQNAPEVLARRGFSPKKVELARRFFNGQIAPREMVPALMRFGSAYYYRPHSHQVLGEMAREWRAKPRGEALVYGAGHLLKGWSIMDRLGGIEAPALVLAGREDFQFPPEHQAQLAAGIPDARLRIIERAGHNAHAEQPEEVIRLLREFLSQDRLAATPAATPALPA